MEGQQEEGREVQEEDEVGGGDEVEVAGKARGRLGHLDRLEDPPLRGNGARADSRDADTLALAGEPLGSCWPRTSNRERRRHPSPRAGRAGRRAGGAVGSPDPGEGPADDGGILAYGDELDPTPIRAAEHPDYGIRKSLVCGRGGLKNHDP